MDVGARERLHEQRGGADEEDEPGDDDLPGGSERPGPTQDVPDGDERGDDGEAGEDAAHGLPGDGGQGVRSTGGGYRTGSRDVPDSGPGHGRLTIGAAGGLFAGDPQTALLGSSPVIDALGNPSSVLLLGGTSDIGLAIVERLSPERPLQVTLAARPGARREEAVARLHRRGHRVRTVDFEATDLAAHEGVLEEAFAAGDVDVTVLAFGVLGDNEVSWQDARAAVDVATVNYTAPVNLGVHLATRLRAQGHGVLVALSSVAGERARRSNFVYGSSKAGFDAFFTGLREACGRAGCASSSCGRASSPPR